MDANDLKGRKGHTKRKPISATRAMKAYLPKAKTREEEQDEKLQALGKRSYESIAEMVAKLGAVRSDCCDAHMHGEDDDRTCDNCGEPCGTSPDEDAREAAQQEIQEDPLSIEVRTDWHSPGETPDEHPCEFRILLGTGGPAVRIMGELDQYGEPSRAWLEAQDWGTPWTEWRGGWGTDAPEVLLTYCRQFAYGVG